MTPTPHPPELLDGGDLAYLSEFSHDSLFGNYCTFKSLPVGHPVVVTFKRRPDDAGRQTEPRHDNTYNDTLVY